MSSIDPSLPKFTGTQFNYFLICHRKLWLFSHDIHMERENENVRIGKMVGDSSYSRKEKEVNIDNRIVIDWVDSSVDENGVLTIHETKKSKSFDEAHRLQVLYYLYYLKQKGVMARGEIDYPLLKRREDVELTAEDEAYIEKVLLEVQQIVDNPEAPPRLEKKRLCEKCAYFELCWS
jgi:CRISPR-associated exonuclease Cas4